MRSRARVTLATMLARLKRMPRTRLDLLIGLVVLVEAQIELAFASGGSTSQRLLAHVLICGIPAGLALRTRAPVLAVALALGSFAAMSPLGPSITEDVTLPFFAMFAVTLSMTATVDGPRLYAGLAIASTLVVTAILVDPADNGAGDVVFGFLILVGASTLAGRALRSRVRLNQALREKTEALERERGQAAERAAEEERTRIAGELHDVVSHALSAMVVQAAGARRLATRDPERAREAFAAVEDSGREALTEMRRLLGVLRREDEEIALAPQPSLAHLSTLIRRAAASGLPVELEVEGEARPLPAGPDLIAYRLVQEALRGAWSDGGAGSASVRLRYGDDSVDLEIADDGSAERPMLAIRERVGLYGGELVAGRRRGGGHLVRARLPVETAS